MTLCCLATKYLLCAIVNNLSPEKAPGGAVVKLVTGILMAAVIIQPFGQGIALNLRGRFQELDDLVCAAVEQGSKMAGEELALGIKDRTEAYILDKAAGLDAQIRVQVTLSEGELPVPASVVIYGAVSPAARTALTELITRDLGIAEEDVRWT